MTKLPQFWSWDENAAVYDGGGNTFGRWLNGDSSLRCRVEIDEGDLAITEAELVDGGTVYVPIDVILAVLERHAEPGTPVWEGNCPSCGAHLDVRTGDDEGDKPGVTWTPA